MPSTFEPIALSNTKACGASVVNCTLNVCPVLIPNDTRNAATVHFFVSIGTAELSFIISSSVNSITVFAVNSDTLLSAIVLNFINNQKLYNLLFLVIMHRRYQLINDM